MVMLVFSRRGEWRTARIFLVGNALDGVPDSWPIRVRAAAREMPGNQGQHSEKTPKNLTQTDILCHFERKRRETRRKLAATRAEKRLAAAAQAARLGGLFSGAPKRFLLFHPPGKTFPARGAPRTGGETPHSIRIYM
jgi:hypothetical protein